MKVTTNQLIIDCISKTEQNIEKVKNTFSDLSENQFNWKPTNDVWSIGECLSHLITTNALYLVKIENLINKSQVTSNKDFPYSQSFMGKMIAKGVDPSNVKKAKTFKVFFPGKSKVEKTVIEKYIISSGKLIELTNKLQNQNLNKLKLSSPVNILIRLNLGDPLIIIPKHDKRHINQAERLMRLENFPKE